MTGLVVPPSQFSTSIIGAPKCDLSSKFDRLISRQIDMSNQTRLPYDHFLFRGNQASFLQNKQM